MITMKRCSTCKLVQGLEEFYKRPSAKRRTSQCNTCRKEGQKKYDLKRKLKPARKKWQSNSKKKLREKYPIKFKARYLVSRAVQKGIITKEACIKCGSVDSQGHHPDYRRPLEVVWVCDEHHKELHKGLGR